MNRIRKLALASTALLTLAATALLPGCIQRPGGTWMFKSAETPENWPEPTPIGEVRIKQYPTYRAATVEQTDLDKSGTSPMFMELFRHIKSNDIAMTAPVDMTYDTSGSTPRMASMAFLYRTNDLGATGEQGPVRIEDLEPMTFASVGVRGDYTDANFTKGLEQLESFLVTTTEWTSAGPPRYLGYNGPFVPWFWRYGEVQIPVRKADAQ